MPTNTRICKVQGVVTGKGGEPAKGARIAVWWQQIRGRQELAAGEASPEGRYELQVPIPANAPDPALIVVEALSEYLDAPLFSPLTRAGAVVEIDLELEQPDDSEWATLVKTLTPSLGGLKLTDLVEDRTHQDLSFLASQSGKSVETLMRMAVSARLEAAYQIPGAVFYAFLRQQVPSKLPRPLLDASQNFTLIGPLVQNIASNIFGLSTQVQTDTLTNAVSRNLIGPQFTKQVSRLAADLQTLHVSDVLSQPFVYGNATLAQLLDTAALPTTKHQALAQALTTKSGPMKDFWNTLGDGKHGVTAEEATSVERTLTIGSFVKNYVPLVQKLAGEFTAGTYKTIHDLARLSQQDWVNLVTQTGTPANIDPAGTTSATEFFAAMVRDRIVRAYPTAALSGAIGTAEFIAPSQRMPLMQFFQNHSDIDLIRDSIPATVKKAGAQAFTGIAPGDQAAVIKNARRFQRVLRLAPDADDAQALLNAGVNSATEIATMGKQQFSQKAIAAGLTSAKASQVFQTSSQRYANVVSLYMRFNRDPIGVLPQAIGNVSDLDAPVQQAIQQDPTLSTLFGSQDFCATDDCTSVLSPAAYLCDLLLWLQKHPQGSRSVLDILNSRRPDIQNLLLNCPNTDTELPYIDLVIELLADNVSAPINSLSTSYVQSALINGLAYHYIVTAVNSVGESAPTAEVATTPSASITAPPAPTGVTASPANVQQIAVSWTAVSQVTSYNIYWSTAPGQPTSKSTEVINVISPYLHSGLKAGVTYYYNVTSVNSAGESAASAQASATASSTASALPPVLDNGGNAIDESAPPAVGGLTAIPGNGQVTLTWNAVPGATSYNVYWSTTPGVTARNGNLIAGAWNPQWKQTPANVTSAELSAAPTYYNQGAFALLFVASYPFTLPYSAGLDELRTYLQHMKLPLWQVRQALLPLNGGSAAQQAAVAAERFSITPHGADLVANANFVTATVAWNTANPPSDLAAIPAFLQASSLSYESLLELLQVTWVQGGLNIEIQGIDDTCMTSNQMLAPSPLDTGFLDRAHRFLRLWLGTGYKMWELDLLLTAPAVANGSLDQSALAALLAFRLLQDAAQLSVNQLLTFYQNIDTATHRDPDGSRTISLYAQIFLNAAAVSVAPDQDLAVVPTGGTIVNPLLSAHLAGIQAALGVSGADAALLFTLSDNQLTLANLSFIYRVNSLAAVSKFSISNLLLVAGLLNPGASNPAAAVTTLFQSPSATLAFLTQATAIQQSKLSLDALLYLLTPPSATVPGGWTTSTQMTATDISNTLAAVQQAAGFFSVATTLAAAIATTTQTSITVVSAAGFPAPNFSIAIGSEILLVTGMSGTGNTTWSVGRGQEGTVAATAASGGTVAPPGGDLSGSVIAAVAANAHTVNGNGLANDVSAFIVQNLSVPSVSKTLLAVLTDPAFTGSSAPITAANFPTPFLAIQLFDKVGVLVRALALGAVDLAWLTTNSATFNGLNFAALPVTSAQTALGVVPLLNDLLLIKLARLWTAAPPSATIQTLYNVIGGIQSGTIGNAAAAQAALGTIAGWPAADIAAFSAALGLVFPADYEQPATYDALRKLEAMAVTAVATGAQIVSWGAIPPDELTAKALGDNALGVLRAQQPSNDTWLALAPTLMNPVRERRSAALQAYLTGQRDASGNLIYGDLNGLFNYFLIDVQMSSCMMTSRVVQAYIAIQTFVERCMMNLEAPAVVVDPTADDTWSEWEWMSRYRIWEANREVFLYPENWLIESQRPNRTETYQTFEQEVRQNPNTADYLETVVLNYVDRLDGLAHLLVTGTCQDFAGSKYVVARTVADPPAYYLRSSFNDVWTGWSLIPITINAHHAIPAIYRGRVCVFWLDVKVSNEPEQTISAPEATSTPPSQAVDRYVTLGVNFTIFRNGSWTPPQTSKTKLFDKPSLDPTLSNNARIVEALYTMKVPVATTVVGGGTTLQVDVYRLDLNTAVDQNINQAVHIGRAIFEGRFGDMQLSNIEIPVGTLTATLLTHAQATYGPDAQGLLPLFPVEPNLTGEMGLIPQAGALATAAVPPPANSGTILTLPLSFASVDTSSVLQSAQVPFRVVGPLNDLEFDPGAYFFFQDNRRCYYVTTWFFDTSTGSAMSYPGTVSSQIGYDFHPFYHPFTRLFWNQLSSGGFDLLYDPNLQQAPDSIDAGFSDVFSFANNYQPPAATQVKWDLADAATTLAADITSVTQTTISVTNNIWVPSPALSVTIGSEIMQVTAASGANNTTWTVVRAQQGTTAALSSSGTAVTPIASSQDRQFLDFTPAGTFAVYNWELFFHIPLYIAQLLSQNQQFEDAQNWFHYIFNPSRQSTEPTPQRFWIPKPFHNLTSSGVLAQQINNLLLAVNQGDPSSVNQINSWRNDPLNPFALADLRPVAYMKATVMSYLDNLIAWGDNLFASESREALGEATLLYVIASEILGSAPVSVTPPQHADYSFLQLQPALDAFANAMVEIENVVGDAGAGSGTTGGGIPAPQTFYFKIPSNAKLLGYWTTVADRLYKLRHCQNVSGAPLQLALFDAPIDPGLLAAAQAAGVDLSSVLSNAGASLPNYRFTFLYSQALDFVNAVRAYGASLQAALEKTDGDTLALLAQTSALQLLSDGGDVLDLQVQKAQSDVDALGQALALAQQKHDFNNDQDFVNTGETTEINLNSATILNFVVAAIIESSASFVAIAPDFVIGAAGFGGTPTSTAKEGSDNAVKASANAANSGKSTASAIDKGATLAGKIGAYQRRADIWAENVAEAKIQIAQTNLQIAGAILVLEVAQRNQQLHQEQVDSLQKQVDFLSNKFTNNSLYDWMVSSLSTTYFQSYQLAYQMCKQVERCYQFELGIQNSSFIQFGYWDSLYKGLLAGETLNHDLRRMQASYLQQNTRRYELSRFVSLGQLNPLALQQLLVTGACDFTLPESLFDNDYPGHVNRRLTRVSVTVVYPTPGKFDNVKATLTLVANRVRVSTDLSSGYAENPSGADPRFLYNYAAVPQRIAMGNGQDDPGLFVTAIASNIVDTRYLPFENAGAISSWHLDMPQANNEVDLTTVGDVVLHLFYTALDGGSAFQQAVQANNAATAPTTGIKLFSAQNDFAAALPTVDVPYPLTPWQAFLSTQKVIIGATPLQEDGTPRWQAFNNPPAATVNSDQILTLSISPLKFPVSTRGKTITVTSISVLAVAWQQTKFVLAPQAPLPTTLLTMSPVAGATEPNICGATITLPPNTPLGSWSFKIQQQGAADFQSLNKNLIGDVLLLISYSAN